MNKPKYTKLDADLNPLPDDHPNDGPNKHLAVRVAHPMMVGSFIVSAYRAHAEPAKFADAKKIAEAFTLHGRTCRAMSVEEAFFIPDRTRSDIGLDTNFFPDAEGYETTWTGDIDNTSPQDGAWYVFLGFGGCYWDDQSYRLRVRPVLSGQSLGFV